MKFAYVTLLSSFDYLPAVIILNRNLKQVKSKYPLIVGVTDNIFLKVKKYLDKENILYKKIPFMEYSDAAKKRWEKTTPSILNIASKIALFKFTEFDKLVYLDSDILIYQNIDDLFNYPDGAMYNECGRPFIGLFVFSPKNHHPDWYYILIQITGLIESDILEGLFFPAKSNPDYLIPEEYYINITLQNLDTKNIEDIKIVHYCYKYKPWNYKSAEDFLNDFQNTFKYKDNKNRIICTNYYFNKYLYPLWNDYPEFKKS